MNKPFETYYGGKEASGVYQTIINHIRPHDVFCEPFGGNYTLSRKMRGGALKLVNDVDFEVYMKYPHRNSDRILFYGHDYRHFLKEFGIGRPGKTVIYFDPPYPLSSRKAARNVYKHEMTDQQHEEFLDYAGSIKSRADILISTYPNAMYEEKLKDWYHVEFSGCDRQGKTTEWLFMNYNPAEITELHDARFYGKNNTERQRIRRQIQNTLRKIKEHPDPIVRAEILKELKAL